MRTLGGLILTVSLLPALVLADEPPIKNEKAVRNAWQACTALADRYNEPGRFTALIGFEWTAIGSDTVDVANARWTWTARC